MPKKKIIEKQILDKLEVKPGMVVRVHQKIKDVNTKGEEKERIQVYEGLVIARKHGNEVGATITVRKISEGIGVEKIFPLNSPLVDKIELVDQKTVRRAKLYYTRDYKKRLKSTSEKKAK
jgi:large subunit ribosomal protein L19